MMSRVTVRMAPEAEEKLAAIYLGYPDPDEIVRASYEIEELLKVDPSTNGREAILAGVDDAAESALELRTGAIPEGLRYFEFGPLEVFFTASELDGLAVIWLIRHRRFH